MGYQIIIPKGPQAQNQPTNNNTTTIQTEAKRFVNFVILPLDKSLYPN